MSALTPRSDALEAGRKGLEQARSPAYGDCLRLARDLEREAGSLRIRAVAAETELRELRAWLDGNMTFYNTSEADKPVLGAAVGRVWYHATNDKDNFPFSEVARGAQQ